MFCLENMRRIYLLFNTDLNIKILIISSYLDIFLRFILRAHPTQNLLLELCNSIFDQGFDYESNPGKFNRLENLNA